MFVLPYLRDQQLYVLFKAVQESLQGAGVGSAALPSPNFRQPSMFVLNLGQNLKKRDIKQCRIFHVWTQYEMSVFHVFHVWICAGKEVTKLWNITSKLSSVG